MVMGTPRTCRAYPMHSLTRPARPARPLAMKAGAEGTERNWGARRVKGHGVCTGGPSPARNEVWAEEKSGSSGTKGRGTERRGILVHIDSEPTEKSR